MPFEPTEAQKLAIGAHGNIIISAAAGSGKTAVLVEHVLKLLSDTERPVDANRLLVVTFTNAAANEMRSRIEKRLTDEYKKTKNRRLAKQRMLINGAKICTIDSFCIDFVKNNADLIGIEPNFKISDGAQESAALSAAFNMAFNEFAVNDTEKLSAISGLIAVDGMVAFEKLIENIIKKARSFPFPEEWLLSLDSAYEADDFSNHTDIIFDYVKGHFRAKLAVAENILKSIINEPMTDALVAPVSELRVICEKVLTAAENKQWDEIKNCISSYDVAIPRKSKSVDEAWRLKVKAYAESIKKLISGLSSLFQGDYETMLEVTRANSEAVKAFSDFLVLVFRAFEENLQNSGHYSFDMVERMALRVLCSSIKNGEPVLTSAARSICDDYDEILVDEYQDTNDLQDTLFKILSYKRENLFTVGDVKQSIYGFRNANPGNFLKRKNSMPDYAQGKEKGRILLSNNFRSSKGVCDFVNFVFFNIMHDVTADMGYGEEESLVYSADFTDDVNDGVEYHIIEKGDDERSINEIQACYIANHIKNIVESGIVFHEDGVDRPIRYGDFAVLMRSVKKYAVTYEEVFKKFGVPVSIETDEFFGTAEIMLAVSVLKVINDPMDDVALLSVLTSELFGFSVDKIAELKAKYRKPRLISNIAAAADDGDEVSKEFMKTLSKLRAFESTSGLSALIEKAYDETGLLIRMSARDNGAVRRDNLLKLLNFSTTFVSDRNSSSLSSFLRYIKSGGEISVKSTVPNESDVVRIMTIHASKGLQFPFCILAGVTGDFNHSDETGNIVFDDQLGIGARFFDYDSGVKYDTIANLAVSQAIHRKTIAEEIRLLYVAMTRAEHKLDIVFGMKNFAKDRDESLGFIVDGKLNDYDIINSKSYSKWLLACALLHKNKSALFEEDAVGKSFGECNELKITYAKPSDFTEQQPEEKDDVSKELLKTLKSNFEYRYPFENLLSIPSKFSVSELTKHNDTEDYDFSLRPDFAQTGGMTAAERGTANHKFLQFCDFKSAADSVQREIDRLYEFEYMSEFEINALNVEQLESFFSSDIFKRIIAAKNIYKEFPFIIPYNAAGDGEESSVVQGVVDCLADTDDGIIIIDYKTDNVDNIEKLTERYAGQVEFYARAISEIFNKPIIETGIYSIKLGMYKSL